MSFNHYLRKARDQSLPLSIRSSSARSCLLRLGGLTGQPRNAVARYFAASLGFDPLQPMTDEQCAKAADALEHTRNQILEQVHAFELERQRDKRRNRRRPTPGQVLALQEAKLSILRGSSKQQSLLGQGPRTR